MHPIVQTDDGMTMTWASCQMHKLVGCASVRNAGVTFSPPPRISDPDMHHGTCVTHVPWCMLGSLTSGFLWSRWWGKRSRHSRWMRNPQFYLSGKRTIGLTSTGMSAAVIDNPWQNPVRSVRVTLSDIETERPCISVQVHLRSSKATNIPQMDSSHAPLVMINIAFWWKFCFNLFFTNLTIFVRRKRVSMILKLVIWYMKHVVSSSTEIIRVYIFTFLMLALRRVGLIYHTPIYSYDKYGFTQCYWCYRVDDGVWSGGGCGNWFYWPLYSPTRSLLK